MVDAKEQAKQEDGRGRVGGQGGGSVLARVAREDCYKRDLLSVHKERRQTTWVSVGLGLVTADPPMG